jgi:signal transduction histidine kinase
MTAAEAERVARVAHELRGPLHAAALALHAARRGTNRDQMLAAAELELERAGRVLLDLEGPAVFTDERSDLTKLVRRQSAGWVVLAATRGRDLHLHLPDGPLLANGGTGRIAQVLGNLVANALEHGSGRVDVRLRALGSEAVVVEISDEGAGLPASVEVLAARPRGGRGRRGRGIAIASEIVATLGGRLSADSQASGARVVVELPARAA